ncbi:tRNA methyltransferase 10 homolog A-like [Biomphalaria glabrata]|uniref:tRNA (guanine(9)-N(1))-methyltransferase n=1 Tax=Biomphalaria glabrata TaxID=6526 RepID=A0A9W2ZIV1_BIOGL|nr:tRNA methyltransferase 10 homolog A-like [Biomphalaria glabrata]XP_055874958.1 tRNA methyltransferase 10 homolog A-like [Biomphalaria glabrata]
MEDNSKEIDLVEETLLGHEPRATQPQTSQCQSVKNESSASTTGGDDQKFGKEDVTDDTEPTISKSRLKKQLKREKWLAIKQEKRRASKQKRKERLAEMRKNGEDVGPSRKKLKKNTMKNSSCKIRVVIDLSFDEYMVEKDVNSLSCQIQHSYSSNRRAPNPLQFYLCSLGGKAKQRLDTIGDYKGWDIYKESKSYEELFPKESLVYLSSESPNVLTSLSEDKVYVIGGLVDHNKHKGLCHKLAVEKGIAHAQLPISEYLDMKTRKVLAINHVFSILLKYTECGSWEQAFLSEMPPRMQAHPKAGESHQKEEDTNLRDGSETLLESPSSSQDISESIAQSDFNKSAEMNDNFGKDCSELDQKEEKRVDGNILSSKIIDGDIISEINSAAGIGDGLLCSDANTS